MMLNKDFIIKQFTFNSRQEFESLPENIRQEFLSHMVIKNYRKGHMVFTEGSYPAGIFYIVNGYVKKIKTLSGYGEKTINLYGNGELIGYAALLSNEQYSDSAVALTNAEIGFMSTESLLLLHRRYEELNKMLMRNLGHEFSVLVNIIAFNAQGNILQRTALSLLIFSEKMSSPLSKIKSFSVPRIELANMISTTEESVVRALKQLERERVIAIKGREISIINELRLLEIIQ